MFRHPGDAAPVLFSGGALIVGGAARTDLSGPELTERLTRHAFETLQHAFADLPDETPLMPTHGSGSFCSTGSGTEHTSTLGEERATNPLLSMSDHTFMESWPATFPRTPAYFSRMREVNWAGPRLRTDIEMPRPLAPKAFADAASEPGSIVVDVRDPGSYAEAHGEGALAIPFRDSFPTWLGWLVPADARLLLVLGDDPLDDVVDACALVGFERFAGYLDGGIEAWREAGLPVRSLPAIGAEDTVPWLQMGAQPLDVREPDELERGTVAGAVSVPLGDLPQAAGTLPTGRPAARLLRVRDALDDGRIAAGAGRRGTGREPQGRLRRVAGSRPRLTSAGERDLLEIRREPPKPPPRRPRGSPGDRCSPPRRGPAGPPAFRPPSADPGSTPTGRWPPAPQRGDRPR